ncbi:hypothetical protein C4F50_05075 [Flavobacterium sp. KB82]|uniref:Uncharacterized protein n=1 Tax=Flavobacterium hungaricum TaxID=2082725 RepID=A0ABR9TGD5_9FLAO|nr:hypothetical protein [Flavobacterium hungaricum]
MKTKNPFNQYNQQQINFLKFTNNLHETKNYTDLVLNYTISIIQTAYIFVIIILKKENSII